MNKVKLVSFPKDSIDKVAGIKAIRFMTGLGLKEATETIEDLQDGRSVVLNLKDRDAIPEFRRLGGEVSDPSDTILYDLNALARSAVANDQFDLAQDIIDLLKKYS